MSLHIYIAPQDAYDRMRIGGVDRLSELLNVAPGTDPLTDMAFQQAVSDANAEVESFVLARYSQPMATIPPLLSGLAFRVLRWLLISRRSDIVSEAARIDYEDAIKALREISDGTRQLVFPPEDQTEALVPPTRVSVSSASESQREFRRNLDAY